MKIWTTRQRWRRSGTWLRSAEEGVAMVSAMLAIFILTIVVAALALATMGETGLSFAQSRSSQVMQLAEGGAYRALAELRRRIALDLPAQIGPASKSSIASRCEVQAYRIIRDYAYPTSLGSTDWVEQLGNDKRAVLQIGSAVSPIDVRDAGGTLIGSFYATIYVRQADNNGPDTSNVCDAAGDRYQMWFDSFIVSTAVTRNARATVCLKNVGNLANCGAYLAAAPGGPPAPGDTVFDTAPFSHGWQILITKASYSRWALMTLATSNTWMVTGSNFPGPVHTNDRFSIWGNPAFASTVTQVRNDVNFGSGGLVADDNYCAPAHPGGTDCPVYNGPAMQRGWCDGVGPDPCRVEPPANDSPFWAVLDQVNGGVPGNDQVRDRTTELPNGNGAVPDPGNPTNAIYFMDECANLTCGGIMVQGDVSNLMLCVAGGASPPCPTGPGVPGLQHIVIITPTEQKMFVLNPAGVQECSGPPTYTSCVSRGKGFNGVIYVNGNIRSSAGNPNTGLYGKLAQSSKLTIAADGEITITDFLVYELLPRPNDPLDALPTVLGVYAWCSAPPTCPGRNVTVDGSLAPRDLHLHGSILAPWGKFWVEGWDTVPDMGTLHFLGGTVQNDFGEFGGFLTDAFGNITGYTGYGRDMAYDARFLGSFAPPFFPLTNFYTADRVNIDPDTLYDRPLWEELAAP